jgi:hypothetical protein
VGKHAARLHRWAPPCAEIFDESSNGIRFQSADGSSIAFQAAAAFFLRAGDVCVPHTAAHPDLV